MMAGDAGLAPSLGPRRATKWEAKNRLQGGGEKIIGNEIGPLAIVGEDARRL
jgi:hypothetical protein